MVHHTLVPPISLNRHPILYKLFEIEEYLKAKRNGETPSAN